MKHECKKYIGYKQKIFTLILTVYFNEKFWCILFYLIVSTFVLIFENFHRFLPFDSLFNRFSLSLFFQSLFVLFILKEILRCLLIVFHSLSLSLSLFFIFQSFYLFNLSRIPRGFEICPISINPFLVSPFPFFIFIFIFIFFFLFAEFLLFFHTTLQYVFNNLHPLSTFDHFTIPRYFIILFITLLSFYRDIFYHTFPFTVLAFPPIYSFLSHFTHPSAIFLSFITLFTILELSSPSFILHIVQGVCFIWIQT